MTRAINLFDFLRVFLAISLNLAVLNFFFGKFDSSWGFNIYLICQFSSSSLIFLKDLLWFAFYDLNQKMIFRRQKKLSN